MPREIKVLAVGLALVAGCGGPDRPTPSFSGPATALKRTVVVATLDEPIPRGRNAVWCASLEVSWRELMDFAGDPIMLEGDPPLAAALNAAPDRRAAVPADALYTFAGEAPAGTVDTIRKEVLEKFPRAPLTVLPELTDGGVIAYAYLNVGLPFGLPYFQHGAPLAFKEAYGNSVPVTAFGIREKDRDAYLQLREQVRAIPLGEMSENAENLHDAQPAIEFALDLDVNSNPNQLILAKTSREDTLHQTIAKVDARVREAESRLPDDAYLLELGVYDTLAVPDIVIDVAKRFADVEGRRTLNAKLDNRPLTLAMQSVQFRLDRSGANLRSEAAHKYESAGLPQDYVLDGPFLIYMKKRGADQPFFAMWVDNAELLKPWGAS